METRTTSDRGAPYDPATSPPPEKASLFEDYIDILHAPAQVFARRAMSGFWAHLLIVSLLTAGFNFANRGVMSQIYSAQISKATAEAMAKNPQLTQEMVDRGRGLQEGIASFMGYVGTPLILLIFAVLTWVLARIVSSKISFRQAALITVLAYVPRLIGLLVVTGQVALMDTSGVTNMFELGVSPARFMDPATTSASLYAVAGTLDVFGLWGLLLTGIGISVIGKVSRARGMIASAILFAIGIAIVVLTTT